MEICYVWIWRCLLVQICPKNRFSKGFATIAVFRSIMQIYKQTGLLGLVSFAGIGQFCRLGVTLYLHATISLFPHQMWSRQTSVPQEGVAEKGLKFKQRLHRLLKWHQALWKVWKCLHTGNVTLHRKQLPLLSGSSGGSRTRCPSLHLCLEGKVSMMNVLDGILFLIAFLFAVFFFDFSVSQFACSPTD